ncbi:transposase [Streptomyces sp. TX20-6-3]|uniref:transposase n=1 Tax=Streptomyces sp. TX20-6-3 TaxID=3028705 RepID=UPI0034DE077B
MPHPCRRCLTSETAGRTDRGSAGGLPSFEGIDLDAGVGVRTGTRILIEVGDGSTFATAGHLAAYASIAPATRSSGRRSAANNPPIEAQIAQAGLSSSPCSPP